MDFVTKDSGQRQEFETGMVRDTETGKPRFDLCYKPMYWRWAELMSRGADKYGARNWELSATEAELERYQSSAERHLQQWLRGDTGSLL
jgi:aminoglycoside phosphotransferase (APT) family kinase protein